MILTEYSETSDFSVFCPKCERKLIRTYMREDRTITCPKCGFGFYLFIDNNMCIILPEDEINTMSVMRIMRRFVLSTGRGKMENDYNECEEYNQKIDSENFDSVEELGMKLGNLFQEYQEIAIGESLMDAEQLLGLLEFLRRDKDIEVHRVNGNTRI